MESLEGHEGIEWTISRSTIHLEKVFSWLMKRWSAGTQLLKCIVGHSQESNGQFKIYNSPGKGGFLFDEKMVSWDPAVEVYRWSF